MGIFKDILLPTERPNWSDETGKHKVPKESILLPSDGGWQWQTNWFLDIDPNFHDKHGWQYAYDFNGPYKKSKSILDFVRRRKWIRVASRQTVSSENLEKIGISEIPLQTSNRMKSTVVTHDGYFASEVKKRQ